MKTKLSIIIFSLTLLTSTLFAGLINYSTIAGGTEVFVESLEASDRAQFIANDIVGQELDLDAISNGTFDGDTLDKDSILNNLGTLGKIVIRNNKTTAVYLKFKVEIATDKEGKIGWFETDPNAYKVTVDALDTTELTNLDVQDLDVKWVADFHEDASFDKADKDALQRDALAMAAATGEAFPERWYYITVTLIDVNDSTEYHKLQADIYVPKTLGQTDLAYPIDDEELSMSELTPTFRWNMLPVRTGVTVYYNIKVFEIDDDEAIQSALQKTPIIDESNITDTSFDYPDYIQPLKIGQKYVWVVIATDGTGRLIGSDGVSVPETFQVEVPVPPEIQSPDGSIDNFPALFSWTETNGAEQYYVQIGAESVAAGSDYPDAKEIYTDGFVYTMEYDNFFEPGKTYYWKVQALDAAGEDFGEEGEEKSFTVTQADDPSRTPQDGDTLRILPPEFSWKEVLGATGYMLSVAKDATFETDAVVAVVGDTSYQLDDPEYFKMGTEYFWDVQAIGGDSSSWGKPLGVWSFNTPGLTDSEPLSPIGEVDQLEDVVFEWQGVDWVDGYMLQVADNPEFSDPREFDTTETRVAFENDGSLLYGVNYYWRVVMKNDEKNLKKTTEVATFKGVTPVAPMPYGPLNEIEQLDLVNFSWEDLSWAKTYQVLIADNRNMDGAREDLFSEEASLQFQNDGSLNLETTYYWQVIPFDKFENSYGVKSDVVPFMTPARKTVMLVGPINEIVPSIEGLQFNWETVEWATKYKLLIANNKELNGAEEYEAFPPFRLENSSILKLGKEYFWKVIPQDDNGNDYGKESVVGSFTTPPVPGIDIMQPMDEVIKPIENVDFRWTIVEGAKGYRLLIAEGDPKLANAKVFSSESNMLTVQGSDLFKAGKTYYFRVEALDDENKVYGPGSSARSFFVANEDTIQPAVILGPIGKSQYMFPQLEWGKVPNADSYLVKINGAGASFEDKIKELEIELAKVIVVVPGATYKWSVQAFDKDGKKVGDKSKQVEFTLPKHKIRLVSPLKKDIPEGVIVLAWEGKEYVDEYQVKISAGGNISDGKEYKTKENSIEVKDLKPGKYVWKVSGLHKGKKIIEDSAVGEFRVKPVVSDKEIVLVDPVNKVVSAEKVVLSWENLKGIDEYKVRLAKKVNMQGAKEYRTSEAKLELDELKEGNYAWQVHGYKDKKEIVKPSAIASFKFEMVAAVPTGSVSSDAKVSENAKEDKFIEATKKDLEEFSAFVNEFIKVNGAGNVLEGMVFEGMTLDGKKDGINLVELKKLIDGKIEIKNIKVR